MESDNRQRIGRLEEQFRDLYAGHNNQREMSGRLDEQMKGVKLELQGVKQEQRETNDTLKTIDKTLSEWRGSAWTFTKVMAFIASILSGYTALLYGLMRYIGGMR